MLFSVKTLKARTSQATWHVIKSNNNNIILSVAPIIISSLVRHLSLILKDIVIEALLKNTEPGLQRIMH